MSQVNSWNTLWMTPHHQSHIMHTAKQQVKIFRFTNFWSSNPGPKYSCLWYPHICTLWRQRVTSRDLLIVTSRVLFGNTEFQTIVWMLVWKCNHPQCNPRLMTWFIVYHQCSFLHFRCTTASTLTQIKDVCQQ